MTTAWQIKALGEACLIKPPKSEVRDRLTEADEVSFLPMEDLGIDRKLAVPQRTRPFSEVVGNDTYFAEGDVLLAKITPCFENGKLGIASSLANGVGFGSSEYVVFRPDQTLSKEWLYYFLSQESFRVNGAARMGGAVGHKRVSKEFIDQYPIPIPPLAEQQRIVGILDEAFAGIAAAKANYEANLQNARALFESHLQSVFSQRGDGWAEKPLSELCDIKHGFAFKSEFFATEGQYVVLTPGNFSEAGELVFTERNTKKLSNDPPDGLEADNLLHNQRIGRVVFLTNTLEKRFLYYFLMTEGFLRNIKASATGTMVKHTAPTRILSNRIALPSRLRKKSLGLTP